MRSVVITGGSGFVGRYLLTELQQQWPQVALTVWDQQLSSSSAEVAFHAMDITDPATYATQLEELQPDWIVHLAAIASVPYALQHPEVTEAVNVQGTKKLLEAIDRVSPSTRLLMISSADIYGRGTATPMPEQPLSSAAPKNPYAASKLAAEKIIEEQFNDRTIRVRPFPHIGPSQPTGFVTADFASQIAAIEKGQQSPTIEVGNLEAQRDFTDVRDVVRAYRLLMERGQVGEVYHVASGVAVSIKDLLDQLLGLSTAEITTKVDPSRLRPSDVPVIVGDAHKLQQDTGWQPTIPLGQSLADILAWWRNQKVDIR